MEWALRITLEQTSIIKVSGKEEEDEEGSHLFKRNNLQT